MFSRKIAKMGKFSTAILLSVKYHSGFAIKLMGIRWNYGNLKSCAMILI